MRDLRDAVLQALAFTMRDFATVRDFEAARAKLRDNLRAALDSDTGETTMKIESTMNLDHLADLMYLTGSEPVDAEVVAMRDLLLQGQESHEWQTTSDVEDAEWFAMLDEAVSCAAKEA